MHVKNIKVKGDKDKQGSKKALHPVPSGFEKDRMYTITKM